MKGSMPLDMEVEILSDDSSPDEPDRDALMKEEAVNELPPEFSNEARLFRRARNYQKYMRLISIPAQRGTVLPCSTWWDLANSVKKLYYQPQHYLTNIHLKKLDQVRLGTEDEHVPLYMIIDAMKAEASIWIIEEIHRKTTSPHHLFMLWQADPEYQRFTEDIFPEMGM